MSPSRKLGWFYGLTKRVQGAAVWPPHNMVQKMEGKRMGWGMEGCKRLLTPKSLEVRVWNVGTLCYVVKGKSKVDKSQGCSRIWLANTK